MDYFSLHIGAHKTASTTLQDYLHTQSEQLDKTKHCFLGPTKLRRTLTSLVHKKSKFRSLANSSTEPPSSDAIDLLWQEQIKKISSSYRNLALSEENILGGCRMLLKNGQLYATADNRLKAARDLLPQPPNAILLCVRNMADFLPSAYCEVLRHSASYLPFRRYIHGVDLMSLSWLPLVKSVLRVFPTSTLHVWRFEDFPNNTPAILKAMFGSDALAHLAPHCAADKLRASLSAKAVTLMEATRNQLDTGEFTKIRDAFEQLFPVDESSPKFTPLAEKKADIMRVYNQDWAQISAQPRVVVLEPA